jgi:hypothetical protein
MNEESEAKWVICSQPPQWRAGEELIDLVGIWDSGIAIDITKPFQYTTGPIVQTNAPDWLQLG